MNLLLLGLAGLCLQFNTPEADTVLLPVKTLRVAIYVFQDDAGQHNFNKDSANHVAFLNQLTGWVNHRLANLDTLRPAMPSPYVSDSRLRIRLDTIFYYPDNRAWDCSTDIDAPYMRDQYVDGDTLLDYRQKYQTLPVFIGGNYPVIGGHSRNIGDRGYIAVRGYYEKFMSQPLSGSIDECGRNLVHEIGHCIGLSHNFSGGPGGDQCDDCEDNGCPVEGTSNNLMDYWPAYGYALSKCQFNRIQFCLSGGEGNISEAVINDSCYKVEGVGYQVSGIGYRVSGGDTVIIKDMVYAHQDWLIKSGGLLRVKGYLSMPIDSKITLEPGARLEIDGGTIGNLCGDLWDGIRSEGTQGETPAWISFTHGGTIENARTGILANGPLKADLNNSVFRNCEESLVFLKGSADSIAIRDCNFRITTKLNHYEEGIAPVSFIRSEGVSSLSVSGSLFINEPGTLIFDGNWLGSGILSDAVYLDVRNSEFVNLTCGLNLISQTAGSRTEIVGNSFANNRFGLRSDHAGFQWIADNRFILQRFNSGPAVGILLNQPNQFAVYRNSFGSVYGGGQLSGLVLSHPGSENSPVFNNKFSNLPVGIFIDNPPDIDSSLLTWAKNMGPSELLRVGPQLRFNRFDTVGLKIAMVSDSAYGSAIGDPVDFADEKSIPATQWNPGGFAWYDQKLPMFAFHGWKRESRTSLGHNLFWFMNLLGIDSDDEANDRTWNSELGEYLNRLANLPASEEWIFGADAFTALERIREIPAVLRSSVYTDYWERFHAEEATWIRESLGSVAGNFVRADSLLTGLGTTLAGMHIERWSQWQPAGSVIEMRPIKPGFDFAFDFPEIKAFRFVRSPQPEKDLPGFLVYPNPAQDYIMIQPRDPYSYAEGWTVHLKSNDGRYLSEIRINSWQEQSVSLEAFPSGLFIIEIYAGNKYLGVAKFIKIKHPSP